LVVEDPKLEVVHTFAAGKKAAASTLTVQGMLPLGPAPIAGTDDERARIETTLRLDGATPELLQATVSDGHAPLALDCCWSSAWAPRAPGPPVGGIRLNPGTRIYYYDSPSGGAAGDETDGEEETGGDTDDATDDEARPQEDGLNIDAPTHVDARQGDRRERHAQRRQGGCRCQGPALLHGRRGGPAVPRTRSQLYCVELAGGQLSGEKNEDPKYTGGPTLTIDTHPRDPSAAAGDPATPRCELKAGVNLFGRALSRSTITISKTSAGATRLEATLSKTGAFGPFTDPSLTLTYVHTATSDQLTIEHWPVMRLPDSVIDIAKELAKKLSSAARSGCSEVGELTPDRLHTRFEAQPSLELHAAS